MLSVSDVGADLRMVDLSVAGAAHPTDDAADDGAAHDKRAAHRALAAASRTRGARRPTWGADGPTVGVGDVHDGVIMELCSAAAGGRRDGLWVALSPDVRGFVDVLELGDTLDELRAALADIAAADEATSADAALRFGRRPPASVVGARVDREQAPRAQRAARRPRGRRRRPRASRTARSCSRASAAASPRQAACARRAAPVRARRRRELQRRRRACA